MIDIFHGSNIFTGKIEDEFVFPWGIVQKLLKPKPNLKDTIDIEEVYEEPLTRLNDLEERVRHLEDLNRFYEEYIHYQIQLSVLV